MRTAVLTACRVALLAGPVVLAFLSGGFFTGPRLSAAIAAWVVLAAAVLATESLAPPRGPALIALGGLAAFTGWTALSTTWAPLDQPARIATELALLYLAAMAAGFAALRPRAIARLAEPAFAAGALIVVGYGIAGRLLPTLVELDRTRSAGGRLDQPLTYWNAEGALAAIGVVLCVRIAGDRTRPPAVRTAAAAAAVPLVLGVFLTFSRGALAALGVGLFVLLALAPSWPQLRAGAIAVEGGAVAVIAASFLPAVRNAEGDDAALQGAAMLVVLVVAAGLAAATQAWSARAEADDTTRTGALPASAKTVGWAVAALMAAAPFAAAFADAGRPAEDPSFGANASRLTSADSPRYEYWEAAAKAIAGDPAVGVGAGGFAAAWLEHREVGGAVRDAHSLELETAAETGLIGLVLLLLAFAGIAEAAARAVARDPALAAGPAAALALWAAHSAIDWDWEMPALTLVPAVLGGLLLAAAQLGEQRPLAVQGDDREDAAEQR